MNKDLGDFVRFLFNVRERVPDPLMSAKNASNYQRAPAKLTGQLRGRLGSQTHLGPDTQVDPIVADERICVCGGDHRCL